MRVTIFSRLAFGYLFVFVLVLILSGYVVLRLGQFTEITQSVLMTNNRMVDYSERLADTLFSQMRNEQKFIVSRDRAFYSQFLTFKSDFERYLQEAIEVSGDPWPKESLAVIQESYRRYQSLVAEELSILEAAKPYPQAWYKQEKERLLNAILGALEKVQGAARQDTNRKIRSLYQAGVSAHRMAIGMTAGLLVFGIVLSYLISRSVTRPIALLVKKTREIGKGDFKGDLHLSSPPELAELASSINLMCQKLNELDRMKSDFFSTVAHELRTPLSSLKMAISVLMEGREGPLTEGQRELLRLVAQENNRLIEQVNDILDLSKMEAGMMTYQIEPRSVVPLIDRVVREMGPLLETKRIRLESTIGEGLPTPGIDTERFLQVLRNVIGNAVKFTPQGGRIHVSVQKVDRGVQIAVSDTGPGIPEGHLRSIFEKFKQVGDQSPSRARGTGLGLAIAKQVVTHHGGKIWAESRPGHGSTFFIQLPA